MILLDQFQDPSAASAGIIIWNHKTHISDRFDLQGPELV